MTTSILDFITEKIVTLDSDSRWAVIEIIGKNMSAIDTAMDITSLDIFSVLAIDEISVQITEFIESYQSEEKKKIKTMQNLRINSVEKESKDCFWFKALTQKGIKTVYDVDYRITKKHKGLPRMKVVKIDSSGQINKCMIYCTQSQYRRFCKEFKITAF